MAISAELGEVLEKAVSELVSSGRYHSKSEVLREGVRLVQERELKLQSLHASINRGLADAEEGRVEDADAFLDRLQDKYRQMAGE